ncbi:hypothetical protein [Amycolatopsis sp. H20-H5]|uniref:hypothetical protein n=1 Tax=Amycolatopsis sp. H20-H5 TaxID=3046309 RepID=UPI002DBF02CA|nr:hypothetical protein [Amycolatopsis sp. H20-H5]MEC3980192.1 hypothetical protein [Amycolatopsis sp. H20-H5]
MTSTVAPELREKPVETAPPAPARWGALATNDFAKMLAVVLAWNVALIAVAWLFGPSTPAPPGRGIPESGIGSGASMLAHTYRWDSVWYGEIVQHGYNSGFEQVRAFYPVFPFAVWLVHTISFGALGVITAGFLVNLVATWLAAVALLKIARFYFSERASRLVVAAFLTAPTAYFLHSFYSEAIFCAIGFWAFLFALRRQWLWMGVLLIPLTATRITAAVFVGLCFLEFWRSKGWKPRGLLSWHLLWFPLAFLGLGAQLFYMKLQTGNAMAGFDPALMEKYWSYHQFNLNIIPNGLEVSKTAIHALIGDFPMTEWMLINKVLPFVGLALLFASSVYVFVALRAKGLPLALFGIASIVMLMVNSNVISVHRYLLPCLVMYIALVLFGERHPRLRNGVHVVLYANSLICGLLFVRFVAGSWTG